MSDNILHIISGDLWGGAEAQAFMQIEAILAKKAGIQIKVGILNRGILQERLEAIGAKPILAEESQGMKISYNALLSFSKQEKITAIVTHGYKEAFIGFLISRNLKIPLITVFHGLGEQYSPLKQLKSSSYNFLERLIARYFAFRILTISKTLANELGFAKLKKLRTIYNCAKLTPPKAPQTPHMVIVGRLVPIKKVDLAIRAWALLDKDIEAKLLIIGEGPEEAQLRALTKSLGLEHLIEFLGFRKDASELIASSSGLLLTSEHEGLPTVLLEAINSKKPVVSSRLGGISEVSELIPSYPILLFDFPDCKAAAKHIEAVLRGKLDSYDLDIPEGLFSAENAAEQHIKLYREVLRTS